MKSLSLAFLAIALAGCMGSFRLDGKVVGADPKTATEAVKPLPRASVLVWCPGPSSELFGIEAFSKEDGTFVISRKQSTLLRNDCTLDVALDHYQSKHLRIADVCRTADGKQCTSAHADVVLEPIAPVSH